MVEVLLYIHSRLIRDWEPRTATSTFTQLLSSDREGQKHTKTYEKVGKDRDMMCVCAYEWVREGTGEGG